jgi:predicted transposase YbfD/YdcC
VTAVASHHVSHLTCLLNKIQDKSAPCPCQRVEPYRCLETSFVGRMKSTSRPSSWRPRLRDRAARMVAETRAECPSELAAIESAARQLGIGSAEAPCKRIRRAALAHGIGAVLGQVAVDSKSNEIPALRELLKAFADLACAVLTMDALHAQHDTAQAALARHADHVMTVKANTPTLYSQLKKLPWKDVPAFSRVTKDHGRRARRTVKAVLAPARVEDGGRGAGRAGPPHRDQEGKKTVQVAHVITSDAGADAATLAAWIQGHRHIENKPTGSATLPTTKTNPWSGQGTTPGPRPRSAAWPSACCAWTATPTSPPPTATTPATPSARSRYSKLHKRDFAESLGREGPRTRRIAPGASTHQIKPLTLAE